MFKTAEAVSIGHPDKTADYISSYILDRLIEQNPKVRYAVEVMIKDNTVILAGETSLKPDKETLDKYVREALRAIGYDERYHQIWGDKAIDINRIQVIDLIGAQSAEIAAGVNQNGWGDQGVFVGYACQGEGHINRELFLARKLNRALYNRARESENLGLDIKTQITIKENGHIQTAVVAIPMLHKEDLNDIIVAALGEMPNEIIINGTGIYQTHSSIADSGVTGRKLACDFYSAACPIGGGSPWTKDPTKADLSLNLYARKMAVENLGDNDECLVYLSSCIGKSRLPSCVIRQIKNGKVMEKSIFCDLKPEAVIEELGLNRPIYAHLCLSGII